MSHDRVQTDVPVVVLDVGYGGLAIARSLGRLGIPVYGIDADRRVVGLASRYWTGVFQWSFARSPAERSVDFMHEVAHTIGTQAVLMPTSDRTVMFVAEYAAAMRERFVFPDQPAALVRSLVNKEQMQALAARAGVATLHTAVPRTRAELHRFAGVAIFPVLAKGVDPRRPDGTTKRLFHHPDELRAFFETVADAGEPNVLVQEYVPGEARVWMFDGYVDRRAGWVAAATALKLRQHPPHAGVASLAVCRHNAEVERASRRLLTMLDYRGPVDIDYAFDPRDGACKILDVNPRIGAAFRLYAAADGMDVARAYYLDMTGQPVPAFAPREGRKWMMEEDLQSCLRSRRDGRLGVRAWARSLRGVRETAWFALDDPAPFLSRCWGGLRRALRPRASRQRTGRRQISTMPQ